jgi:DNA mismatch repair protein MutS2
MHERTVRVLEFDKIVKKLMTMTTSVLGKEIAQELLPETNLSKVDVMLEDKY